MSTKFFLAITLCFLFWGTPLFAQVQTGKASFYGDRFEGRITANGETYSHDQPTAAHRYLPFGTKVQVTNLANDASVIVRINDRGPFVGNRIIDLSRSSAEELGFITAGVTDVVLEVLPENNIAESAEVTSATVKNTPADSLPTADVPNEPETKTEVTEVDTEKTTPPTTPSANPREYYEVGIHRVQPDWFGIQLGSFQEMTNLMRMANQLATAYEQPITIQVKTIKTVKIYSLIIGKFTTRRAAENFKQRVNQAYPDSFIVDLATQ